MGMTPRTPKPRALRKADSLLHWFRFALVLSVLFAWTCSRTVHAQPPAQNSPSPTLRSDRAHPAHAQHWVGTQLYFGLGPADTPEKRISEAAWRDFLDHEVTPRFPSGLSVVDVYGQWQGKQETTPERIHSKLLIIYYPATRVNAVSIEAIRAAWKQRTGDQSVLKVTAPASVSF
jgi:hypothetical protein